MFKCVVEDAGRQVAIDRRRVYVFGHSMGGYLAYDAATLDSEYFAAVAVHAMGIAEEYVSIVRPGQTQDSDRDLHRRPRPVGPHHPRPAHPGSSAQSRIPSSLR